MKKMKNIFVVDTGYFYQEVAAIFVCVNEEGRISLVETNTARSVSKVQELFLREGLSFDCVDWIFITHVHLDHAGGTSAFLRLCPRAKVVAHPRAAKHLIDPSRLVASAEQVYGKARFKDLYGEILPIDPKRVVVAQDRERFSWGSQIFEVHFTRGHANHHFVIFETVSRVVFTGDAFGLRYPGLKGTSSKEDLLIFPSTSPTEFDEDEALRSIDLIMDLKPSLVGLTHFGWLEESDLPRAAQELREGIRWSGGLVREMRERSEASLAELSEWGLKRIEARMKDALERRGWFNPQVWDLLRLDMTLNAQGLATAAKREDKKSL